MIKANDARVKTEAYHAHNESAILTMLETIEATIIYHAAHGDSNATYQPPVNNAYQAPVNNGFEPAAPASPIIPTSSENAFPPATDNGMTKFEEPQADEAKPIILNGEEYTPDEKPFDGE